MTIYLIRHGETEWNRDLRFQGHQDSPLTDTGKKQAQVLALRMQGVAFDKLYASDLGRALETAATIARLTHHDICQDARLRERNYGVLEGLTEETIKEQFPEVLTRLRNGDPEYIIPQGESHRQHYQRNMDFWHETMRRPETKIAVVAHGGVLDSFFRNICGLALGQPRCFTAANTSLAELIWGTFSGVQRWLIKTWGDVSHLNGLGDGQ